MFISKIFSQKTVFLTCISQKALLAHPFSYDYTNYYDATDSYKLTQSIKTTHPLNVI